MNSLCEGGADKGAAFYYDNDMKLEHHYDGQHFPCYLCQPAMLVVGIFPKNAPEGSSETTWLTLPCSEQ